MGKRKVALYHAFHTSLPIMAGYGFLGLTYGIYMHELGFNFLYPMLLAITVYAGSAEFLLGNMLLGSFHPLQAFLMVLMVNARHLFYGLSMLEEYKGLDFVLTAMFTAIFADNWLREKDHTSSISGLIISGLCLTIFSADNFIIPSMVIILLFLTLKKEKYAPSPTNHHGFSRRSRHHAHPFHSLHRLPTRETYT